MFDPKKPTVLLLGRWQPWHEGHLALFERALAKTGQVVIQVRDVEGSSGGEGQDDNPFSYEEISKNVAEKLFLSGYKINEDFIIQLVPNITNICYGRDVGYNIEEINLPENVKKVSATTIRSEMRKSGQLK